MDSAHRKDLKTDKFVEEVAHSVDFLSRHKAQASKYAAAAAVLILLGGGYWWYSRTQATARTEALAEALHVTDAVIGPVPQPPNLNYATQELKDAAVEAAYTNVANKYGGTQQGAMAQLYLASLKADKGQVDEAIKLYQTVIDTAPSPFDSVGKLSLSELYGGQGKTAEAEKLLRSLIESPTVFASKEEATLRLGQLLADSNPAEARKLLEPLKESRTAVSRAAIATLGTLPAAQN